VYRILAGTYDSLGKGADGNRLAHALDRMHPRAAYRGQIDQKASSTRSKRKVAPHSRTTPKPKSPR